MNLLGKNDSPYCEELKSIVCKIAYEYILNMNCKLFFNLEFGDSRGLALLRKFLQWVRLEDNVKTKLEITSSEGIEYVEVTISIDRNYLNNLEVIN